MDFIKNHGGSTNAYTDRIETNYYFEIQKQLFEEALDMMAWNLIHPNLATNCIEREMQAVDSEWKLSLTKDDWKLF